MICSRRRNVGRRQGLTIFSANLLHTHYVPVMFWDAPLGWWAEGGLSSYAGMANDYDEENRLAQEYAASGRNQASYFHDAQGQLYFEGYGVGGVNQLGLHPGLDGVRGEPTGEIVYTWSGSAWTGAGHHHYVLGPGADERLAFVDTDRSLFYPHADKAGSTLALSQGGRAVAKFSYGPYGEAGPSNPAVSATPSSQPARPGDYAYRYTGQRLDGATGYYDYKARFYWPTLGSFLQPDPAGADSGPNLYQYADSDPLNHTDPGGMECVNSSNGTTNCSSAGKYDVPFKTPSGFQNTTPGASDYHQYSVPNSSPVDAAQTRQWVQNNPTPGNPSPATPQGTPNNVTPSPLGGAIESPVTSYETRKNVTGNNVVVNATMPGHPLGNGIVVRDVTPNANGTSVIQNYGEGNGRLQAPGSPVAREINGVWASPGMRPSAPQYPARRTYDLCASHPGAC